MRSSLGSLAPVAWLAIAGFGIVTPLEQARSMSEMISICSEAGVRFIERPVPGEREKPEDCIKGCHALCQRKRMAGPESPDSED